MRNKIVNENYCYKYLFAHCSDLLSGFILVNVHAHWLGMGIWTWKTEKSLLTQTTKRLDQNFILLRQANQPFRTLQAERIAHGLINCTDTKTKCCLYLCLIEFITKDTVGHAGIFDPAFMNYCPSNLLSYLPPAPPHLPPLPKSKRGSGCVESMYRSYTLCVFDQIPSLQNCFNTPNKT